MKWFSAFVLVLMSVAAHASSQPIPAVQMPLASEKLLTDIEFNGQYYVAVGERGHIIYSDNLQSWQQADVPVNVLLTAVTFVDANNGWAVGHDAAIVHTGDGGKTWSLQHYDATLELPFLDVAFVDSKYGVAIGAYGAYWVTLDGGQSWHSEFHDELLPEEDRAYLAELKQDDPEGYQQQKGSLLPHFNRLLIDSEQWLLVGEGGLVAVSKNKGLSWQALEQFYDGSLFDIKKQFNGGYVVVGLRGNAFVSDTTAENWQTLPNLAHRTFNSAAVNGKQTLLVGNSGVALLADGNGQLSVVTTPTRKAIMAAVATATGWVLASEEGIKFVKAAN